MSSWTRLTSMSLVFVLLVIASNVRADRGDKSVRGGATTIVTGGTGAPSFVPVKTTLAFNARNGTGRFECLAVAPSASAGTPGSGNFDTNVMYVTGQITSVEIQGTTATLKGIATVTGVGAGVDVPFTAVSETGGPGTRFVLEISGLTFDEILLDGEIRF